jgi:branched-chain amino acid transport system permease protein
MIKRMTKTRWMSGILFATVIIAALIWLPLLVDAYILHWATTVFMYVALTLAWDILARTGQISFGHAAFFGLGAYIATLASTLWGVGQIASMLFAGVVVAILAAMGSLLFLRVRGIYFAILTLALAEVLKVCATMLSGITGGAMGLSTTPLFGGDVAKSYFFILVLAVLIVVGLSILTRTRYHFGITAIRSSPEVAAAFGIPVRPIRTLIFGVSAGLTGLVGAFYAFFTTYINPESAFDGAISVAPVIMSIFGGLYSIPGAVIGAVTLTSLQEYLRTTFDYGYLIIYGLLLVLSILFMPKGVWGFVGKLRTRRRASTEKA